MAVCAATRGTIEDDLFFRAAIEPTISNPRFVRHDWLAAEVNQEAFVAQAVARVDGNLVKRVWNGPRTRGLTVGP